MVTSIPVCIIVGSILGFLSGLGVGGGSLLMIWLTAVAQIDYPVARSINLLFFIPTAIIASIYRWKQGSLRLQKLLPAILAGVILAAVFSILNRYLEITLLKKLFGILLLFTGLREIFYRPRKFK